jgi:ABC-2 type transport system ATP-binding protein
MDTPAIKAEKLRVVYRPSLFKRPQVGLEGLDLEIRSNEVFGYLGANGAGKTTTIKTLVGLIEPNSGSARIMGRPAGDARSRHKLGYAPENPYFYEYLNPVETLDFYGRLFGISRPDRLRRANELLERVGLASARNRRVRQFSKGMRQRMGLAQALINDPELLILDEPMTGLDPLGRYEIRQMILGLKQKGKTIFFSSHILADVEAICDRAAVLHEARLVSCGALSELLSSRTVGVEITLADLTPELEKKLGADATAARREGELVYLTAADEESGSKLLSRAVSAGATVKRYMPTRESLEDYFIRIRREADANVIAPGKQPGTRNPEPETANPEDSP